MHTTTQTSDNGKASPSTPENACSERTIAHILTHGKVEYLDYDFKGRLSRRGQKQFDLSVAEKNLLTLKSVFERHGITFWLVYGTCLGAVRDGGFIPHDTDTDLAVFMRDKQKVIGAMPDLMKEGLVPIRTKTPDDLLTFMRDDEYIDIGLFSKHRDEEKFEYWSYQDNRVYSDHFDKFDEITFLGQRFLIPQRVEAFLTTMYGAGWKAPVANRPAGTPQSHREFREFSNLLVLSDFFRDMPAHAVLKLPEHFPNYYDYSDLDILCADREAVSAHIRQVGQTYTKRGFVIKLDESSGHLHLDFYAPGAERLNCRFDLLDSLDGYKKVSATPDFVPAILADRFKTTQHGADVYVPALTHDLALRFLEFIEWKDERPEKIKHWHFIEKKGNFAFVDVVNRFTDLKINVACENGSVKLSWARQSMTEAKPSSKRAVGGAKDSPAGSFLQQAESEFAAQRFDTAAELYCAELEIDANQISVLLSLGECLREMRDVASAEWCHERAATLERTNPAAEQVLDRRLSLAGDSPADLSATPSTSPIQALLNSTLTYCNDCLNRQDFSGAWQALGRAIRLAPTSAETRVHRAQLALFLNDADNAVQGFGDALRLDPHCAAAHAGLARLCFRCGKLTDAEEAADRALKLNTAEEEALQVKAECAVTRLAPQEGAGSDYYRVTRDCPLPAAGHVIEALFAQRANGTFVECDRPDSEGPSITHALTSAGWKGSRVSLEDGRGPSEKGKALRQALRMNQVEPGFEVLCVTAGEGECSLLSQEEISFWRPQLVVVTQSAGAVPAASGDLYSTEYFQEQQYLPIYARGGHAMYVAREKLLARRSRMDCFLIWGHGMAHRESIVDRIRARSALEIIAIHRRPTGDMTKFVQDLYACDTVPFEHLRSKTRYLLTTPPEVIFILVRNQNAQEKYYGDGAFRHIQCALIKDVKEEVRNAWNPRANGKRSEDHVIHATDYDSQVDHTLKVLGLPTIGYYRREPNTDYDLPYHLEPFSNCREVEIPLKQLHARILGIGVVPIEQTPQYRFVAGDREPYLQYYARHFGQELTDDHSGAAFDKLIATFDYGRRGRSGKPGLLVVSKQPFGYLLHDGVHRASILKHQGVERVRVLEMLAPGIASTASGDGGVLVASAPPGSAQTTGSGLSAFEAAIKDGEQFVRDGRLAEARSKMESALKLAPTEECAATAREILALLDHEARASAPIVVRLMGGLGNQMFQYAAGLALARRNKVSLKLDLMFLQDRTPRPNITPRNYGLDIFALQPDCQLLTELRAIPAGLKRTVERHFHYDPAVAQLGGGIHLEGYWQSPRYFEEIEAEIRQSFEFSPALDETARALAVRIAAEEAVCLHVRRGDMVRNSAAASVHGTCSAEYYRTASDLIANKVPAAHFFIFSDDPDWCATQDLTRGRPHTVVSGRGAAEAPAIDLFLMRRCRHFIIANSSFSWWAAYLSTASGKTVVAPDPWFTDPSMDISDLFPTDWIRLSRNPGPVVKDISTAPIVSVVVPCYNQAHYLQEVVETVVGQSFADWELIVVNDGSPDDTSRVTRELIARHPDRRIRLLEKPNGGLGDARNAGISEARGKFILPLDADDKLHPQMLQKTVALLKAQPKIAIAYTDMARFGVATDVLNWPEYDFPTLLLRNHLNCCSLFRREAWTAVGGYNKKPAGYEDWDFWIACGEKGYFGKRIPEPLFFYRVKSSSMFTEVVEHHQALHAQIIANHPRLYSESTRRAAAEILAKNVSPERPAARAQSSPATSSSGSANDSGQQNVCPTELSAPEEFFGSDEVQTIEQLCAAYAHNPADAEISAQIQSLQQGLIRFLVTAPVDQLEALFNGTFGRVYRAVLNSGLPSAPSTEESRVQLAVLEEALDSASAIKRCDHRFLLARMLCAASDTGVSRFALDQLPAWVSAEYSNWLVGRSTCFGSMAENEGCAVSAL